MDSLSFCVILHDLSMEKRFPQIDSDDDGSRPAASRAQPKVRSMICCFFENMADFLFYIFCSSDEQQILEVTFEIRRCPGTRPPDSSHASWSPRRRSATLWWRLRRRRRRPARRPRQPLRKFYANYFTGKTAQRLY